MLNVGLRQPIDLARMAATVAAIAAGGCELGLGAGWMPDDFEIAGMTFDSAAVRLSRLEESVEAIKRLWTQETTTFSAKYVRLKDAPGAQSAGRDPAAVELSTQICFTAVAPDPGPLQQSLAEVTGVEPVSRTPRRSF